MESQSSQQGSYLSLNGPNSNNLIAIAVDYSDDNPIVIDSTYRVYKYASSGWFSLGIYARDISKGYDGSYCYVSTIPAYSGSSDYRIYVIKPSH